MKKEKIRFDEREIMIALVKSFVGIFKWCELCLSVILAGLSVSFLIVSIIKGNSTSVLALTRLFSIATLTNIENLEALIVSEGLVKFTIAGFFFGAAKAFTYGLKYIILQRVEILFNDVIGNDKLFTKDNVDFVNNTIPLTFFVALTQPVIIYVLAQVTKIISTDFIDISGILFIVIGFFIALVFNKGYEETKKLTKTDRLLSDAKAIYSELKMEVIAKDAQLKSKVKELNKLKETKEKKEEPKEEKKRKPRTKKEK